MYFTLQPVKMPQSVVTENREQQGLESGPACHESYRQDCGEMAGGGRGGPDGSPCSPPTHQQQHRPPPYEKSKACMCAGCGGPIQDRYYLLAADQQWHTECLRCCECKVTLDNELTCFAKDGGIYCKEHYFRRFGVKKCARCGTGIAAHEMVMRARSLVYHLSCFTCSACSMALTTGDYYGMRDTQVYCRLHYESTALSPAEQHRRHQGENQPHLTHQPHPAHQPLHSQGMAPSYQGPLTPGPSPPCAPSVPIGFYNGMGVGVHKGRPRKRKGVDSVGDYCRGLGSVDGHLGLDGDGYVSQQSQRTKRMRTSFKHHQLRTMKTYFSLNHNPDAKDLKQLAQKTGLTKRVLQVWFQNARAKYRRSLLKKEQGDKSVGSPPGQADLIHGNSVSSPSTNGRSSPTSTTGGVPSLHGGCDTSSGSELGSIMMGSPVEDDGSCAGSYTSEGLSYSELKNASELSPAVADDVLTISAMPACSPNHTLAGDCLPSPNALNGSVLKTNLVDIFN